MEIVSPVMTSDVHETPSPSTRCVMEVDRVRANLASFQRDLHKSKMSAKSFRGGDGDWICSDSKYVEEYNCGHLQ